MGFTKSGNPIYREIKSILTEFGRKNDYVAAELNGTLCYLTEVEVRALQVLAARKASQGEDVWEDFNKSVVVYSGKTKRKSRHIMKFRKDGSFSNKFEDGFFDTVGRIHMQIIRNEFSAKKALNNN